MCVKRVREESTEGICNEVEQIFLFKTALARSKINCPLINR